jgi:nicotinamidase-related amidase
VIAIGVDLQKDFMNKAGSLYVPGSEEIKPNIVKLLNTLVVNLNDTWFTQDWHNVGDPEISMNADFKTTFPPHCMADTDGALFIPEVFYYAQVNGVTFKKDVFSVWKGGTLFKDRFLAEVDHGESDFLVFGVAGDVCVRAVIDGILDSIISGDIRLRDRVTVQLVKDCCASISPEKFDEMISNWRTIFRIYGHRLFVVNHDEVMV